jgi:osmotically-inducible protein OsmY
VDVQEEITWDPRIPHPTVIGVAVQNGVVTLTGQVYSYAEKEAAEDAAFKVNQVKAVANDITIRFPSWGERTDTEIAQTVLNVLKWDALIPTEQVEVTVSKGRVTLNGEVVWGYQRTAAQHAVARLAGVTGVNNHLVVTPRPLSGDIRQRIEKALVRNAEVDAQRITVEIQGNRAILRGAVRSFGEKREAESVALAAPGITSVENHITVT